MSKKETVLSVVHANAKDGYRLGILCEDYYNSKAKRLIVKNVNGEERAINAMRTYRKYGSITFPGVSRWLIDLGYASGHENEPLGLVKFYFEQEDDTDIYTFVGISDIKKVSHQSKLIIRCEEHPYETTYDLIKKVWK